MVIYIIYAHSCVSCINVWNGAEPPPTHLFGHGCISEIIINEVNTILKAFARVVNKPNLGVLKACPH